MAQLALIFLIAGIVLIAIECSIPGFGFFGITGVISLVVFSVITITKIPYGIFIVVSILSAAVLFFVLLFKYLKHSQNIKKVILNETLDIEPHEVGDLDSFLGKEGIAVCPIKPQGKAEFNGLSFDVCSDGRYIPSGRKVRVIGINNQQMVVKEVN